MRHPCPINHRVVSCTHTHTHNLFHMVCQVGGMSLGPNHAGSATNNHTLRQVYEQARSLQRWGTPGLLPRMDTSTVTACVRYSPIATCKQQMEISQQTKQYSNVVVLTPCTTSHHNNTIMHPIHRQSCYNGPNYCHLLTLQNLSMPS